MVKGALRLRKGVDWGGGIAGLARAAWPPLLLGAAGAALGALMIARILPTADVSWQLVAAERLLAGGQLYSEIADVNLPAIVYLNVPGVWLARTLGWPVAQTFLGLTLLLTAITGIWIARALRGRLRFDGMGLSSAWLFPLTLFAVFAFQANDYGQRETFALLAFLPHALFGAERSGVDGRHRFAAALFAGAAATIKPHFVLALVLSEGAMALAERRAARLWRWENLVSAGAWAVLMLLMADDLSRYFELQFPLTWQLYSRWGPAFWPFVATPALLLPAALLPLLLFAGWRGGSGESGPRALRALSALALAFAAVFVVQQKGLGYQALPLRGAVFMASALFALGLLAGWRANGRGRALGRAALVLLLLAYPGLLAQSNLRLAAAALREGRYVFFTANLPPALALLEAEAGRASIANISVQIPPAFPLVSEAGLRYEQRDPSFWPLAGLYDLSAPPPPRLRAPGEFGPLEAQLFAHWTQELASLRPDYLLVGRHGHEEEMDLLSYLSQDPGAAALLARYEPILEQPNYRLYRRAP